MSSKRHLEKLLVMKCKIEDIVDVTMANHPSLNTITQKEKVIRSCRETEPLDLSIQLSIHIQQ